MFSQMYVLRAEYVRPGLSFTRRVAETDGRVNAASRAGVGGQKFTNVSVGTQFEVRCSKAGRSIVQNFRVGGYHSPSSVGSEGQRVERRRAWLDVHLPRQVTVNRRSDGANERA